MAAISIAGWQKPEGVSRETSGFSMDPPGPVSRETDALTIKINHRVIG
jgi:hypothetical protein